jgi:alpha-galactosidase
MVNSPRFRSLIALLLVAASTQLAPTPTKGFSTWNFFNRKGIGEKECMALADALVDTGLVDAGYTTFIVDEPCFTGRDSTTGVLLENRTTWPNGLKKFSEYLTQRNMTLGIYTDAGPKTCAGCEASFGHEQLDMDTFGSWGATYVKVDRCFGVDSVQMVSGAREPTLLCI